MNILFILCCLGTCIMISSGKMKEKVYLNKLLSLVSQDLENEVTLFRTYLEISVHDCIFKCKYLRKCRYFNYASRSHTCQLLSGNSGNIIVTKQPGVIFGDSRDWAMSSLHTCPNCTDNESCIPDLPGCRVEGCGSPEVSNGTAVDGNVYSVDAKLKYECAVGYSNTGSSFITCESNGQWSTLDTCIQEVSQCPITANYESGLLDGGTSFKYWLVEAYYTHAGGTELCLSCQGKLVEILTYQKLSFFRNILINKGDGIDYWIDGSNVDDPSTWNTATGAIIPLTSDLWAPDTPNNVYNERCVRLKPSTGYYFDNYHCQENYRVICEKPN